ncbi:N-acetylmuramoyl-L-alanine amidase [Galactobacter sp.]|uniref:N-acetylmuramoyl-L-alanine amidase n=1 Tax=Galactobacter sp. TaxID=2676125 RepID=UPI0025BA36F0|nr:N-acetylmuramoyl-L-alanine amidase [Galactobacter sp.]
MPFISRSSPFRLKSTCAAGTAGVLALALVGASVATPGFAAPNTPSHAPSAASTSRAESASGTSASPAETARRSPGNADIERITVTPKPTSDAGKAPAAQSAQAPLTTSAVVGKDSFTAAGVTWKHSERTVDRVELRLRKDGAWTAWTDQEIVEGPNDLRGTEPVLLNDAEAAQARVFTDGDPAPQDMKLALVGDNTVAAAGSTSTETAGTNASGTNAADARSLSKEQAGQTNIAGTEPFRTAPASAVPSIKLRSSWGPNEDQTSTATQNKRIDAFYVHHTAGSNSYKNKTQAEAQIRADWNYHTNVLNWGDLGYHIMIDKFGNIYEGRRGSINSLPLGTHAGGFNTNTYSVSLLGNYEEARPSAAMMTSLRKVLAWKAYEYNVDTTTTVTLTSRALPGSTSRYKKGVKVSVPRLIGHTTTNATACPGQYVIPKLPALRTNVASDVKKLETSQVKWTDKNVKDLYAQTKQSAPIYAVPRSGVSKLATAPKGATVTVTHHTSLPGWYKVKYGAKVGYMGVGHLNTAPRFAIQNVADYYKRLKHNSPVYKGADPSWGRITTLTKDVRITVTHKTTRDGWYRIKYSGGTGYLWKSHLDSAPGFRITNIKDQAKKLKNTSPIYKGAGTSWGRADTLKKGQKVTITHKTSRSGWYRTKYTVKSGTKTVTRTGYIWHSHI